MTRINCHSSFKHYEMFHSRHCGGDSFGSIFNTTYNINTTGFGGGGSFWGGFGLGLGNAFGNMFGGLFGGSMNMFGGGLFGGGMNMFGGGMFGNYGFPSWGNPWGTTGMLGGGNVSNNSSRKTSADDPDCKVIDDLIHKVNDLLKKTNPTENEIKALEKEIDNALNNLDDANKYYQTGMLNGLKDMLKGKTPKKEDGAQTTQTTQTTTPSNSTTTTPTTTTTTTTTVNSPNVDNIIKNKDKTEALKLLKDPNANLTDEQKIKLKELFYEDGYTNVKINDLDGLVSNTGFLKNVIDEDPNINNLENIKSANLRKNGQQWTLTITTKGNTEVKYSVKENDGELVFTCTNYTGNQEYVLQKDNANDYHLIQYKYHKGYGEPCVSVRNKVK